MNLISIEMVGKYMGGIQNGIIRVWQIGFSILSMLSISCMDIISTLEAALPSITVLIVPVIQSS